MEPAILFIHKTSDTLRFEVRRGKTGRGKTVFTIEHPRASFRGCWQALNDAQRWAANNGYTILHEREQEGE